MYRGCLSRLGRPHQAKMGRWSQRQLVVALVPSIHQGGSQSLRAERIIKKKDRKGSLPSVIQSEDSLELKHLVLPSESRLSSGCSASVGRPTNKVGQPRVVFRTQMCGSRSCYLPKPLLSLVLGGIR